jgi:hypothetical protein
VVAQYSPLVYIATICGPSLLSLNMQTVTSFRPVMLQPLQKPSQILILKVLGIHLHKTLYMQLVTQGITKLPTYKLPYHLRRWLKKRQLQSMCRYMITRQTSLLAGSVSWSTQIAVTRPISASTTVASTIKCFPTHQFLLKI